MTQAARRSTPPASASALLLRRFPGHPPEAQLIEGVAIEADEGRDDQRQHRDQLQRRAAQRQHQQQAEPAQIERGEDVEAAIGEPAAEGQRGRPVPAAVEAAPFHPAPALVVVGPVRADEGLGRVDRHDRALHLIGDRRIGRGDLRVAQAPEGSREVLSAAVAVDHGPVLWRRLEHELSTPWSRPGPQTGPHGAAEFRLAGLRLSV
jgi:hypothetical protein